MSPSKINTKELAARVAAKAKALWQKHLDRLALAMIGLCLGLVGYMYYVESTAPVPVVTEPKTIKIKQMLALEDQVVLDIDKMGQPLAEIEDTTLTAIIQINMFDAKAAKSAEQVARQAREKMNEAKREFEQGNLREARTLAQGALEMNQTLTSAKEMIRTISERLGESAKEAPTVEGEGTPEAG